MVTISRIRTEKVPFWASIRVKILLAFFVVVGTSFLVAATNLTGVVNNYLTEQRTREDTQAVESLAAVFGPLMQTAESPSLNIRLRESADSLDGRLMLLDQDGKVQYDSFNTFCGQRLQLPEVLRVLSLGEMSAYGMHRPGRETVNRMSGEAEADYVAYGVHELLDSRGRSGAIVYVSRIQSMMDSLRSVRIQLITVFILIALAALMLALFLSRVLTTPIVNLSRTMRKMGKGDLSVRVPEKGSGELRQLAENYNIMAAQLENLDKSRNQFVSNASHELKTPLASMKIMLETMIYQPEMPAELKQEFMQDMNEPGGSGSERHDGGNGAPSDAGGGEEKPAAGGERSGGTGDAGRPDQAEPGALQSDRQCDEIYPGRRHDPRQPGEGRREPGLAGQGQRRRNPEGGSGAYFRPFLPGRQGTEPASG